MGNLHFVHILFWPIPKERKKSIEYNDAGDRERLKCCQYA